MRTLEVGFLSIIPRPASIIPRSDSGADRAKPAVEAHKFISLIAKRHSVDVSKLPGPRRRSAVNSRGKSRLGWGSEDKAP